jgi:hypothetical protein
MASRSGVRSHIHSWHPTTATSFVGCALNNQWHSPSVHFSMKRFKTFFIINSDDMTSFHLVRSMSNMLYPSFGGMTLMATNQDAKHGTTSLSMNGVYQWSHKK